MVYINVKYRYVDEDININICRYKWVYMQIYVWILRYLDPQTYEMCKYILFISYNLILHTSIITYNNLTDDTNVVTNFKNGNKNLIISF